MQAKEGNFIKLSKSQAHYVKAVHELSSGCNNGVRVCDIAEKLSLSKASASLAMTKLAKLGLVYRDSDRHVHLTKGGEREAVRMLDKVQLIQNFLIETLGVDSDVAAADAYAIEDVVSLDTICAMCRFTKSYGLIRQCEEGCPISLDV